MPSITMPPILERQTALQKEADDLVAALDLEALLLTAGKPVRVGSSAMGLMVKRDIDLTVVCQNLGGAAGTIAAIAGQLMLHPLTGALRYRNDSGLWNREPHAYPDGLYIALTCHTEIGRDWNLDIWFIDEPERQPDLAHLKTLAPRLTDASRETILAIKTALADSVEKGPPSVKVYEAVLDHGITDVRGFRTWLARQN